jgi:hypothetical protein
MVHQQLVGVPAQYSKTSESLNDAIAKALLRSTNEVSRIKRINEMLKTELSKTRLKLRTAETELFRINGRALWHAREQYGVKNCASGSVDSQLTSALHRISCLEVQLAESIAQLDLEVYAREDMVADHTCFLCMEVVHREQRMVTECCHRFDACASCYAEWLEASSDHTCPFCRQMVVG